ncbi:ZCHC9 protein, partial [Atractosteus spatula]|nr:ZCHC9 protein [Atractosteus spatula]
MTRWARANNVHRRKPAEATPWGDLKEGCGRGAQGPGPGPSSRRGRDPSRRKPNRKKKEEYDNEDVNGFLAHLRQAGVPGAREDVALALKKDQRREERRLKRQELKKTQMVCFNCRKPGHRLADCPEADEDEEMGRGICYRCGSTEHELQRCRAKVDPALGDFPFAKCFICGQTGHLSKSCPDNPKGMYAAGVDLMISVKIEEQRKELGTPAEIKDWRRSIPQRIVGLLSICGCCRVCGSVEHFQKDCPEHQGSGKAVTVGRLSNNMSADHEDIAGPVKKAKPKQPKVVTF